jgi:predicted XRE-type DNA-binding protein
MKKARGPWEEDLSRLLKKESKKITGEKNFVKLKLANQIFDITYKMTPKEIREITGLHKSDISRLWGGGGLDRFTIDRLVTVLEKLGYEIEFRVKKKKDS